MFSGTRPSTALLLADGVDDSVMADDITYEVHDSVAAVTIDRYERHDAIDHAVGDALDRLDGEEAADVGVITGADETFCAGADLKDISDDGTLEGREEGYMGFSHVETDKPSSPPSRATAWPVGSSWPRSAISVSQPATPRSVATSAAGAFHCWTVASSGSPRFSGSAARSNSSWPGAPSTPRPSTSGGWSTGWSTLAKPWTLPS